MRAEMETGRLRADVLAADGITADEWTVAQRHWLGRMGAQLERGRFDLTNIYTQAFLARQRELAAQPTAPTTSPPPAATPTRTPPPDPRIGPEPCTARPTYLIVMDASSSKPPVSWADYAVR